MGLNFGQRYIMNLRPFLTLCAWWFYHLDPEWIQNDAILMPRFNGFAQRSGDQEEASSPNVARYGFFQVTSTGSPGKLTYPTGRKGKSSTQKCL